MSHEPLAFLQNLQLKRPSSSDKTADKERLLEGLRKAGFHKVEIPVGVLRKLPEVLRKKDFQISAAICGDDSGWKVIDIGRDEIYGLAVDIGSTNIELSLFALTTCQRVYNRGFENAQVRFGPDVLTRVQRSMTGDFDEISGVLLECINESIGQICEASGVSADHIVAVTVAGNTIESHFFTGLDVRNIPLAPYVPAVSGAIYSTAREIGLKINGNALVYLFPNAGSYVGGDIISGMISSGIYREEKPCLFIDVGTNVEITLGCKDWIMTGAGAAGPALEGGIAAIGKKADPGTISKVKIDKESGKAEVHVIGGGEPSGICGSGIIDLISEMFSAGVIDRSGLLTGSGHGTVETAGMKAYPVYASGKKPLYITQTEIKNFILSKAAMFSFLYVFVKSVGLTFKEIEKVYVAGALGCGINIESAINIGMLPDMPREKFFPLGNSSLRGAEMVLLDRRLLHEVGGLAQRITYREMNEDPELMSFLQGAMFLPHTEPDLLKG